MNAVEIEEAVSQLASEPFDAAEFPFAFLFAFGNKEATIKRLRTGATNKSDVGGVLQRNHIHIAVAETGQTGDVLQRLRESPQTSRQKAKFILATDGEQVEAEDLNSGETIACAYADLNQHFGFFLPLAGISTVREVKDNPIDVKATGRLNKLYCALRSENEGWETSERRQDLNRFMARLIFCFFAEDTGIFNGDNLFTETIRQMTEADGSNTRPVLEELFRAMNTRAPDGAARPGFPSWADRFPYVNGGLFEDAIDCPDFSRTARAYLLRAGELDWRTISPDIFGSMIQAVADDDERGNLGLHYTSVPNIHKVLDPLFLDDLREQLEAAGTNKRKLYNLRQRLTRIRVFDPACGSGNFLVIAYIRMREIEEEIMRRRGEALARSAIKLTQFYGIEIKSFAAEIARLSLLIAEFQCDVRMIGQREARALVLPLHETGNIVRENALRIDWEEVCPPANASVEEHDLGGPTGRLSLEGAGEAWETYICGNPPYLGNTWQSKEQKAEIRDVVNGRTSSPGFLDYVSGWFIKAADYSGICASDSALVSTNSICQGQSVSILWPIIFEAGCKISFAHTSFKWANLASHKAGVTVAIIGLSRRNGLSCRLFEEGEAGSVVREGRGISPYLTLGEEVIVNKSRKPVFGLHEMEFGNKPSDGGHLLLHRDQLPKLGLNETQLKKFIKKIVGSQDFINGEFRHCIWIEDDDLDEAQKIPSLAARIDAVRNIRLASPDKGANALAKRAHQLKLMRIGKRHAIVVPSVSSERRQFLPVGLVDNNTTLTNLAFAIYDAPIWHLSVIASRLHLNWIAAVCGKLETRYRYSNTLGWNTFPVPKLTEQNKADLTRCAEDILLAREAHFPATIAELYDPEKMPDDLRAAHDRNDETLECIYIGRRFRNDTERLEKLFDMYAKMTAEKAG